MTVAVKVIQMSGEGADVAEFVREIEVLQACKSPYIVQFLGANLSHERIVIVTELMARGSLQLALRRRQVTWIRR